MKSYLALLCLPLAATLLPAATITPVSYRYTGWYPGDPYNSEPYRDWWGTKLTDGVAEVPVWGGSAPANIEPLVGWLGGNARIVFDFGQTVNIDSVTIWAANSGGSAGVWFPIEVSAIGANFQKSMQVTAPSGLGQTAPILFSTLDYTGSTLTIIVVAPPGADWIMVSEVAFSGPLSAIPEPATYALLAGVAVLGAVALRHRNRRRAQTSAV